MARRLQKNEKALLKKLFNEITTPITYEELYNKFHNELGYKVFGKVRGIRIALNKLYTKEKLDSKIKKWEQLNYLSYTEKEILIRLFNSIEKPIAYLDLLDMFHKEIGYEKYKDAKPLRHNLRKWFSEEVINEKLKLHFPGSKYINDIGTITFTKTKDYRKRYWIKISETKQVEYHKYLWEKEYGEIPKGYCLVALNGDYSSSNLSNYKLVSQRAISLMNVYKRTNDIDLYGKGEITEASLEVFETEMILKRLGD